MKKALPLRVVQPPSVVIAANPYEAELCRRALVDTGLQVLVADGGEGALEMVLKTRPLVLVVALGLLDVDSLDLVRDVRIGDSKLPIFLLGDREGEVRDEDAAARLGATRLFLRPIEIDALADAIEKRAVEAEIHDEVSEAIEEFSVRPPTIDAAPLVEESIVELEADYGDDESDDEPLNAPPQRVPREPTQVLGRDSEPVAPSYARDAVRSDDGLRGEARASFDGLRAAGARDAHDGGRDARDGGREARDGGREARDAGGERDANGTARTELASGRPSNAGNSDGRASLPTETVPLRVELKAPSSVTLTEPLLRADDALDGVGLQSLVGSPDFVRRGERPVDAADAGARTADGERAVNRGASNRAAVTNLAAGERLATKDYAASDRAGRAPRATGERADDAHGDGERGRTEFDERGSFARRLENELSAAERRLFPNTPSTASGRAERYEDALGDIDLDALGIDTIPGIGADAFEGIEPRNGKPRATSQATPEPPIVNSGARADAIDRRADAVEPRGHIDDRAARPPLPDDEGDLAEADLATLVAALHSGGFSGALTLGRGDGEKTLFFDDGLLVGARSMFVHDRLADLLVREGTIGREAQTRVRDIADGGRRAALQLVERGLIKSSELFAVLRRHVEEIFFSCFAWERGHYRLGREQSAPEDRVRMGSHPWALVVEGVRRKYSLERLVERVGPPETVLTPTTALTRALEDCALTPPERDRAELLDGERSLAELQLGAVGAPLAEAGLYALAWGLIAVGAARFDGDEPVAGVGVRAVPTLVTTSYDRRRRPRPLERARDRDADRAVDKERVLAKRAQVQDGDYFAVLGLARDASPHEVARAFERLKREYAPERFAEPLRAELASALAEISAVLDEAHRVLADDRVRKSYRDHLPPPA